MKTILIAKGGSVFRTRDQAIASGEQGETEGVIRHLLERNDIRLIYFGCMRGSIPGLEVIEPCMYDLDELTTARRQKENFLVDNERLHEVEPVAFIQTAGYSPTFSMVDNPRMATVQAAAIRYTAPMHNALHEFHIPRIVINNDPRTYPRDQEMSYGWSHSRPAALLDQQDKDWSRIVGGKPYKIKSIHARCESWAYLPKQRNQDLDPCVVVAHAHFKTGIKHDDEARHETWHDILGGNLPHNTLIYGEGWEYWKGGHHLDDDTFQGKCSAQEAVQLFNMHTCGPVVSHTPGFYTGKPWIMMSQGCIPLLHKDYDPKGLLQHLQGQWRLRKPGDLKSNAEFLFKNESQREDLREKWENALLPNWDLLDSLVDDIVSGQPLDSRYGGYEPM